MSEQSGNKVSINIPSKPRPRASLSRFSGEMAKDKWQKNQQIQNSSRSPNIVNSFNQDSSSSASLSSSYSSSSSSSTPELHKKINEFLDFEKTEFLKNHGSRKVITEYETEKKNEIRNKNLSNKSQSSVISESTSGNSFLTVLFIIAVIALVFAIMPDADNSAREYREIPSKKEILKYVKEQIVDVKKEFENQDKKIWEEIYSGIAEIIFNPMKPSIFVLFADRNDPMYCLALTISELARKALRSEKSLILKPTELDNDTGEVIETLRLNIPQRKSVIFWDLLSINDEALKVFHNLCDRENPLVKEAIYIITVKAEGYNVLQKPLEFIENKLRSNLSGRMDEDSIMPLITRITDGPVISVRPELNIQCKFKSTVNY